MSGAVARLVAALARALAATPRPVAMLASVAWMAFVFVLSSGPRELLPPGWLSSLATNAGHAAIFGVLALLAARAAGTGPRAPWLGFAVAVFYGAADEWHQSLVPGRTASLADLATDAVGAAGALWIVAAVPGDAKVRRRLLITAVTVIAAASVATILDQTSAA